MANLILNKKKKLYKKNKIPKCKYNLIMDSITSWFRNPFFYKTSLLAFGLSREREDNGHGLKF